MRPMGCARPSWSVVEMSSPAAPSTPEVATGRAPSPESMKNVARDASSVSRTSSASPSSDGRHETTFDTSHASPSHAPAGVGGDKRAGEIDAYLQQSGSQQQQQPSDGVQPK